MTSSNPPLPPQNAPPPIPQPQPPLKTSGLAIGGLVVAIIGFCVPAIGVIGALLGAGALLHIRTHSDRVRGAPIAGFAIATGLLATLINAMAIVGLVIPAGQAANRSMMTNTELMNVRQIAFAQQMYAYQANANGYTASHPILLIRTQAVMPQMFVSPYNAGAKPPTTNPVPPAGNVPFRYGDFFFTYPQPIKVEHPEYGASVIMFGLPQPENDNMRSIGFGDGSAGMYSQEEFEDLIADENDRRAEDGTGPQIDLDALPGAMPPSP